MNRVVEVAVKSALLSSAGGHSENQRYCHSEDRDGDAAAVVAVAVMVVGVRVVEMLPS